MLRVPELKAGEQPFDPAFAQTMTPWKNSPAHTLALGEKGWKTSGTKEKTPEEQIQTLLNLAVVKEAVTELHRREDEQMRLLEDFTSARICDIPAEHETFLREQTAAGENVCKNEDQKALFHTMTKTFVAQSRARAQSLQYKKAVEYWREAVEGQNNELLARALRPENVTDDKALAMYRDLILYNMENMLANAPEQEKREKLNAARAAFQEKVIEKRLEIDPAGALAMSETAEARRSVDEAELAELTDKAKKALREAELTATAQSWADEEKSPEEAKQCAQAQFTNEEEQWTALEHYSLARFVDNKTRFAALAAAVTAAWEQLKVHTFDERELPAWIRANDPELAQCLRDCLHKRGDAGGGEGAADYARFMGFLKRFKEDGLGKTLEHLRDGEHARALLLAGGGPDAACWTLATRLLAGTAEPGDKDFAAALRLAWGEEGRDQRFMEFFANELHRLEDKSPLAVLDCCKRLEEHISNFLGEKVRDNA